MEEYSNKTRKKLKEISAVAYERDIARCLEVLHSHFKAWKDGDVSVFELNELIHEYHDGASRSLYSAYTSSALSLSVAFGLRQGVLEESEIPEEVRDSVKATANLIGKNI